MEHRSLRLTRGWLGALTSVSLAASSHTVAGGQRPEPALLVVILALAGAACTALAGHSLTWWRTTVAVGVSQGIYHLVFGLMGGHAGHGAGIQGHVLGAAGTHVGHGGFVVDRGALVASAAGTGTGRLGEASTMWMAHLAAAVCTVLVLRRGGLAARALLDLLRLAAPAAIVRRRCPRPAVRIRRLAGFQMPGLPDLGVPMRALRHRGPPARSAIAA